MNTKFKITAAVLSAGLIITPLSGLVQNNQNIAKANEELKLNNVTFSEGDLISFFEDIEKIPNDLLENGTQYEINNYLRKNNIHINIYNDKLGETAKDVAIFRPRSFWGCVGALGTLLVTTAVPAAKILKIKKYVRSLGGVTDAVRYLLGIKGAASGGEALKNLILELSGIASVTDNCF